MESLTEQFCSFAATLMIGVLGGFCYDYYRAVRRTFRFKKMGTWLGDIFFWMVTTALVFILLLLGNWGVVRYYVFFGLGLGALIYFQFFSNAMSRLVRFKFFLLKKIWDIVVKLAYILINMVFYPFRLVYIILSYPLNFLELLYKKACRKLKACFNTLILMRVGKGTARLKLMLLDLAFWNKKKND
ncbi:MAG: Spore cortex protein YabQ (Spore_YabQ) [Pelotomaculum sp. PtaB.Bin104]|nr:MAG: Spore cortex protein YabQ (Spore_YabQ) [Pelotomaculum sp. PtaB.Bin104]